MRSLVPGATLSLVMILILVMSGCSYKTKKLVNLLPPECSEEPDRGYCRASITKYYFDLEEGECKPFVWGGCGGVLPFDTEVSCRQMCLGEEPASDQETARTEGIDLESMGIEQKLE